MKERVRWSEVDSSQRTGIPTRMAEKMKALERENREPRRADEILGRASVHSAMAEPFSAWIDDWFIRAPDGEGSLDRLTIAAQGGEFFHARTAGADGPLVLHGQGGYPVRDPVGGQATTTASPSAVARAACPSSGARSGSPASPG